MRNSNGQKLEKPQTRNKYNPKGWKIDDITPPGHKNGYPEKVPRWYTRFFEILPGFVTWAILTLPITTALLGIPELTAFYVTFLTVYWSWRGLKYAAGVTLGYLNYKREIKIDWEKKVKDLNSPELKDLKYVCVLPFVNEGMEVIKPSVEAWANSNIDMSKFSLVFGIEERTAEEAIAKVKKIEEEYGDKFREILYYVHPNDIENEVMGVKGANLNWATRLFAEKIEKRGEKLEDYLLITNDIDLRPHPKYMSAITYKYLTTPKENRLKRFYSSAVHTFENNIWRVPVFCRVHSMALTLTVLHVWAVKPENRDTWSAYVVNLKTAEMVGYWDPEVGIDDTPFYWNARVIFGGDFKGIPVYVPTYNDAVENVTTMKTYRSLYKQQLRWGWGIVTIPITLAHLYKNRKISLIQKAKLIMNLLDNQLIFLTVVYMITFALPIAGLFSPEFEYSAISHTLPRAMSYILTGLMILNLPVLIVRRKIHKIPKGWNVFRHLWDLVETFLLTVNMLTIGFIPKIHAQTLMLFKGSLPKRHYHTEKVIMKENKGIIGRIKSIFK